jgi:hypothetical protein
MSLDIRGPVKPPTIQEQWSKEIVGLSFAGVAKDHIVRISVGKDMRTFWTLQPLVLSVGTHNVTAINEQLAPVKLTINVRADLRTGLIVVSGAEQITKLNEVGLSQKQLDAIVGAVLDGHECYWEPLIQRVKTGAEVKT